MTAFIHVPQTPNENAYFIKLSSISVVSFYATDSALVGYNYADNAGANFTGLSQKGVSDLKNLLSSEGFVLSGDDYYNVENISAVGEDANGDYFVNFNGGFQRPAGDLTDLLPAIAAMSVDIEVQ